MLLKVVCLVVLLQIVSICGNQRKFMIKNMKTGQVLCASGIPIIMAPWKQKNSQLWTMEPSPTPGRYYLRNVGNGKVLDACPKTKKLVTWRKHGGVNQRWSLDPEADGTRFSVQYYSKNVLVHKNGKAQLVPAKQNDNSDMWLLVDVV